MNLCKNCKHIGYSLQSDEFFAKCIRDAKVMTNLISGREFMVGEYFCNTERKSDSEDSCGPEGKFFIEVENSKEKIEPQSKSKFARIIAILKE